MAVAERLPQSRTFTVMARFWDDGSSTIQLLDYRNAATTWTAISTMPPPKAHGQKLPKRPLPPLPKLRVKNPNVIEPNPCLGIMSSVLSTSSPIAVGHIWESERTFQKKTMQRSVLGQGVLNEEAQQWRTRGASRNRVLIGNV